MPREDFQNWGPLELTLALHESLTKERHLSQTGQSTVDFDTLHSLEDLTSDINKTVRTLINSRSPINQLPFELLSCVFSHVPLPWAPKTLKSTLTAFISCNLRIITHILPLTSVCKHWRNVALGSPSLWSTILDLPGDLTNPPFLEYFHRSAGGPLFVALKIHEGSQGLLQLLQENHERVQELYVDLRGLLQVNAPAYMVQTAAALLATSFPNIRRCAILEFSGTLTVLSNEVRSRSIFGNASQLYTLTLILPLSIPSNSFPLLTHLNITNPKKDASPTQLIPLLSSTPQLQVLKIHFERPERRIHIPPIPDMPMCPSPIKLPYLTSLSMTHLAPPDVLNDDYHALAHAWRVAVLSPLAFPPSCKVHFHPVRPQDVIHSARLLNSCRDIEAFACMKLATDGLHSVHMHMSHKPWPMEDPPPTSFLIHPLPASATLSHFGEMELARGRLRSTLSTPEFAHIRQLILLPNMLEWLFTSRRNNLLHTFRDLTHLCVTVNGFSEEEDPCMPVLTRIFATLCPPQDNGRGKQSQNAPPACPALAHLWLEWVINKRWMRDSPVLLVSARIHLERALAARAARGYPLTSVFISRGRYGDPRGPPKVALEEYDSAEARFGKTELVGDEEALFKRLQPHWAPTLKSH